MRRTRTPRRIAAALTAGLLLVMALPATPAAAVEPPLEAIPQQVFGSPAAAYSNFSSSVAISGETAVVGAPGENTAQGAAYVFTRHGGVWFFRQRLAADVYTGQDWFGCSVAISGNTALIGASGYDNARGAAFVFVEDGGVWTQQDKLTAPSPVTPGTFGASVALDGETALIGATGEGAWAGAAYVFTRAGGAWSFRKRLVAADGAAGDCFGGSVALDDGVALVGASYDDSNRGAAYAFSGSGAAWSGSMRLTANTRDPDDCFGGSVALFGATAIVGALGDDDRGAEAGAAYVFTRVGGSWTQEQKLHGSAAAAGDEFGSAVAVSGGAALIGACYDADGRGAAYLFTGGGNAWTERHRFADAAGETLDYLGTAVALSGGTALVGAYGDNGWGTDAGSAWFLSFNHPLTPGVVRVAGANRYATAIAASRRGFPAGAPAVVVATGTNWPDALGGSALAGAAHGPLLLTKKDALPAEVTAEITRLGAVKAYVLGSTAAVGSGVENTLVSLLGRSNVVRLGGANRYQTAVKVAEETKRLRAFTYGGTVFITTGTNYPDATAASPVAALLGAPVVLVNPASSSVALPAGTVKAVILGSTAAVPAAIETDLVARLGRPNVYRQGGANRYDTAAQLAFLASFFGVKADAIGLATGTNFPDALTAGPMLARSASALVLTRPTVLPGETKGLLEAASASLKSMFIFGDYNAVSAAVEAQARAAAGL